MNNVTDLSPEKTLDHNPVSNPFQLSKTKGPIKLIPLHAALRETVCETGHGISLSESTSATSSTSSIETTGTTSDIMSPKSGLGESPFSFRVLKLGSANLTRSSSMTNSLISDSQRLIDHQKEITKLKKDIEMKNIEIESKEAKLSSSVKSIKQFWSPELKKERALRKEETEKNKLLKEQFENENIKYENTNTKLEDQSVEEYKNEIKKLGKELFRVENILAKKGDLHEVAKCEYTEKINEVKGRFAEKEEEYNKLQDELAALKRQNGEQWKKSQANAEHQNLYEEKVKKLQENLSTVQDILVKKDNLYEVAKREYTERIDEVEGRIAEKEDELSRVGDLLSKKEDLYEAARHEYTEKINQVEVRFAEKEEEYMKLQDEEEKLDMEIKNLEEKVNSILASNEATESTLRDLETEEKMLRKTLEENEEKLCEQDKNHEEEKQILLRQNKDMEHKLLQTNEQMHTFECHIVELQDELQKARSTIIASDAASQDLDLKTKEVHELTLKYNKLNKFLLDRQEALDTSCGEVNELKERNLESTLANYQLIEKNKEYTLANNQLKERNQESILTINQLNKKNEEHILCNDQLKEKNQEYTLITEQLKEKNQEYILTVKELEERNQQYTLANDQLKEKDKESTVTVNELKENDQEYILTINQLREKDEESILTINQLKEKNEEYILTNNQLIGQVSEQKVLVSKLEKEKMKVQREKEDFVPKVMYQKLKMELEAKEEENINQKKVIDEKESTSKHQGSNLKEKEETNEEKVKEVQSASSAEQSEINKIQEENDELVKEIAFLKLKVTAAEKQRSGLTGDEKPLVGKKYVWDELSKKDSRIGELERLLKEKGRQFVAMKSKITDTHKGDENAEEQLAKLKTDVEQKVSRISLLEETLREMVGLAKKRENIMARYAEVYEEVQNRYEDADREYSRICFERNITNIKNALLILIICEREALISSMKVSHKSQWEELFTFRQERLMVSISELDTEIAHLESQAAKSKQAEINKMKREKEKHVTQLKELNNQRILKSSDEKVQCIANELRAASPEEVYEAVRHISQTYELLESKIEELLTFLRERNADLLKDITDIPIRSVRPNEELQELPKEELMQELTNVEEHSSNLQKFVENLLTLLEGDNT